MTESETIKRPGVLNKEQMAELIRKGIVSGRNGGLNEIEDGSSFDIHLSKHYWELPAGFKCRKGKSIKDILQSASSRIRDIREDAMNDDGLTIEKNKTRIFEIQESIELPEDMQGQGTGRSSVGRIDVLTRLLTDKEEKYDCVTGGEGRKNLYVEVTPLSFPIRLFPGDRIYQIRIIRGKFDQLQIQRNLLSLYSVMMKDENKSPITGPGQACPRLNLNPTRIHKDLDLEIIAFKAKDDKDKFQPLKIEEKKDKKYIPEHYWEPITQGHNAVININGSNGLRVRKDDFYILRSRERFTLPNDIAVYGVAMTEEVGELRIHHAGFVHPLFGAKRKDKKGTPLIFEVRGHDIDMYLVDGDLMANLRYYPMSEPAKPAKEEISEGDKDEDPYEEQELKLSKIFKDWGNADRNP